MASPTEMKDQPMADLSGGKSMPLPSSENIEIQMESVDAHQNISGLTCNSPSMKQALPTVTPKTNGSQSVVRASNTASATHSYSLESLVSNIASPPSIDNNTTSSAIMGNANIHSVNVQDPRRSGRERTSTLIYVDGYAIKKDNNYVLKGLTYEYGVAKGTEHPPQHPRRAPKTPSMQPKAPRAPPTISQAEINRKKTKQDVAKRVQEKQPLRQQFLKQHVGCLEPFLEPKVVQQIKAFPSSTAVDVEPTTHFEQPKGIKAEMRDYQVQGLQWMGNMYSKNLSFILGDEMGLGKTLQTLSLVVHLKETYGVSSGPSLIVCPLSVLYSWCNEIKKWTNLKFLRLHLSNANKMEIPDLGEYDMVVTTYEMCKVPALNHLWSRQHFNLVVLDEGHRIKGINTLQSQAVRKIHSELRCVLSGTPLANNLVELYALLNFLLPDVFTTAEPFEESYNLTTNVVNRDMLDKANKVLNLFMIRRLKTLVEKKMPPKIETKVFCPLSNSQIWWYKALLMKDLSLLTGEGSKPAGALNNVIMQLRKCVNHPFLFPFAEDHKNEVTLQELVGESGKLAVLDKLLCSLYKKGHRVCLFSQFTSMLDIVDDYARLRGWNFCRFDGGTARAERNFVVNSFNEPGSQKFLFLMSTTAGGVGLNLQTADTVILMDSSWNPQLDIQAEARVHRIGQTKTVFVYRLVTKNTIEERIIERAEKKMFMAAKIMKDGSQSSAEVDESEDAGQMMDALKFGCNAVFGDKAQKHMKLPSDEDVNMLTDRNRTEAFTGGNIQGGATTNTEDFDESKEFTSTMKFGGIDFKKIRRDYQKKRKPKDLGNICDIWRKRQRKSRITLVDGNGTGYGGVVPVLKANDYDLESGERSVFQQELGGRKGNFKNTGSTHLLSGRDFQSEDVCQVCGDGGSLLCCPRCPVAVHAECAQCTEKSFMCCSHHHCIECGKNTSESGGFMFRCSCCPRAFCEDHLPKDARQLDRCERMEELGYTIKNGIYVLCSPVCENVAVQEYNWVPPDKQKKAPCPAPLDVTRFYGGQVDDCLDTPEDLVLNTKRRRKQSTKYGEFETSEPAASANPPASSITATTSAAAKPAALTSATAPSLPNTISASSSGASVASSVAASASGSFDSSYASLSESDASVGEKVGSTAKPKAIANAKPSPVLSKEKGEYMVFLPVIDGSLNVMIAEVHGATIFLGYKKYGDGTKSLAEMRHVFRNKYDRIIGVNGLCVCNSTFTDVLAILQSFKEKGALVIRLHMQEYSAWQASVASR